jgi:hypothetical protein
MDFFEINPISRIPLSNAKCIDGVRKDLVNHQRIVLPYNSKVKQQIKENCAIAAEKAHLEKVQNVGKPPIHRSKTMGRPPAKTEPTSQFHSRVPDAKR